MSEPLKMGFCLFARRSSLIFIKLLLRSGNQGSLKSDERMSDLKEGCAQLCIPNYILYMYKIYK